MDLLEHFRREACFDKTMRCTSEIAMCCIKYRDTELKNNTKDPRLDRDPTPDRPVDR